MSNEASQKSGIRTAESTKYRGVKSYSDNGYDAESESRALRLWPLGNRPNFLRSQSVTSLGWFVLGSLVGVSAGWILDPISGRRRRALVRDQAYHYWRRAAFHGRRKSRNAINHVGGVIAETINSVLPHGPVDDVVLVDRVRSKIGRKVSHPRSVHVEAKEGEVILSGLILEREVANVLSCVHRVPGVKRIVNHLEAHQTGERISGLQS